MANNLIPAAEFCTWHHIEYTFIDSLQNAGLITIEVIDKKIFVFENELTKLEKMIRLHHDLEINIVRYRSNNPFIGKG